MPTETTNGRPGDSPRIQQILEVLDLTRADSPSNFRELQRSRVNASHQVAESHGVVYRTVIDKLARGLDLPTMDDADQLIWSWLDQGDTTLRTRIEANIPRGGRRLDLTQIAEFFERMGEPIVRSNEPRVWWVNQGKTVNQERDGGYIWAVQRDVSGRPLAHHDNVNLVRSGDIIFHYSNPAVYAISTVVTGGREGPRPEVDSSDPDNSPGYLSEVMIEVLDHPISRDEIPVEWRNEESSVFTRLGGVNQVYLVPLSREFWEKMLTQFGDRLPRQSTYPLRWQRILRVAAEARSDPEFDSNERDYKLEVAKRIQQLADAVIPSSHLALLKDALENPPNNLINWRHSNSMLGAFSNEERLYELNQALRSVRSQESPQAKVSVMLDLFESVDLDQKLSGRLALATLFAFGLDPASTLFVRTRAFDIVGGELGSTVNSTLPLAERYDHYLEFANNLWRRLEGAGVSVRDMVDVQSLIYIASQKLEEWKSSLEGAPETNESISISDLSSQTFLQEDELTSILKLIEARKQVIFEGPPGGGKTWVADKLARYLTGNPLEGPRNARYEIVQFHQSYGYEDFVQGIRPLSDDDGKLRYELRAGAFKRLCQLATENPDQTYVMLVDEINRGNISRILGELLFLLEYRKDSVRLAYSDEDDSEFSIPQNIRLLGTMNTTDRSLTQIDYALRRRFFFKRLMPVVDGRAAVLEGWLAKEQFQPATQERLLRMFLELNRRITASLGEHFQVGHSYFMRKGIEDREVQEELFKYEIHPLLEEYFFNSSDQATIPDRYSIESLLAPENPG